MKNESLLEIYLVENGTKTVIIKRITVFSNIQCLHLDPYAHKLPEPSNHPLHLPKYQLRFLMQE